MCVKKYYLSFIKQFLNQTTMFVFIRTTCISVDSTNFKKGQQFDCILTWCRQILAEIKGKPFFVNFF